MTDAQRKKRAERIIDFYKTRYSVPFWIAYKDSNSKEMGRRLTRRMILSLGFLWLNLTQNGISG